jgi:hypothetical protein
MSIFDIKMREKMVGAPKKPKMKPIRMSVSAGLHSYLGILARDTVLGGNENDVAKFILTQRLEAMREADYHLKNKLPKEGE